MWKQEANFLTPPTSEPSPTRHTPSNDDIEAIIKMATSTRPTPEGRQPILRDTRTQLFVGNLPYRVRWQDLKDLFRKAGTVLRADVSLGPDNRSRGYGTVLLATAEDAGRAVDMFNGYSWQTRVLEVRPDRLPPEFDTIPGHPSTTSGVLGMQNGLSSRSVSSQGVLQVTAGSTEADPLTGSSVPGRSLFVGNLPFHCQWQDLKDLFRQAGTVMRADVALGLDGRSRGFGTVVFASEEDAARAVSVFNGFEFNGRALKVHHDKFTPSAIPMANPGTPALLAHLPSALPSPFNLGGPQMSSYPFSNGRLEEQSTTLRSSILSRHPTDLSVNIPSGPSSPTYAGDFGRQMHASYFQSYLEPGAVELKAQHSSQSGSPPHKPNRSGRSSPNLSHLTNSMFDLAIASVKVNRSGSNPNSTPRHSPTRSSQPRSPTHPAHPGNISLPPPGVGAFGSIPSPHMMSPLHHPLHHTVPMTPHGLPPMTPSMPPFNLLLQPSQGVNTPTIPQQAYPYLYGGPTRTHTAGLISPTSVSTPPGTFSRSHPGFSPGPVAVHTPHHLLSPGVVMSPGAFWGRPGSSGNPYINTAVGAPVHGLGPSGLGGHPQGLGIGGGLEGEGIDGEDVFGMGTPGAEDYGYGGDPREPESYFPIMGGPPNDVLVGKDGSDNGVGGIGGGRGWNRGIGSGGAGRGDGERDGNTPSDTDTTAVSSSVTEGTTRSSSVDVGEDPLGDLGKAAAAEQAEDGERDKKQSRTHSMSSARPSLTLTHRPESDPPLRESPPKFATLAPGQISN